MKAFFAYFLIVFQIFFLAKAGSNHLTAVATLVKKDGKLVSKEVTGCARFSMEYEKCELAANTSTKFLLASNSKHMTAAIILMLEEDGKLKLEDEITQYLKALPDKFIGIKIKHLIFHTAGMGDFINTLFVENNPKMAESKQLKQSDFAIVVQSMIRKKNYIAFSELDIWNAIMSENVKALGKESIYSNSGYHLLSKVIESVEQKTLEEVVKERIFDKLDMKDASFIIARNSGRFFSKKSDNQASIYFEYPTIEANLPKIFKHVKGEGGFAMSINDYEKWINAIDDGTLFRKPETLQKFLSVGTYDNGLPINNFGGQQDWGYGYGIGFTSNDLIIGGKTYLLHTGGFDRTVSLFLYEPLTKTWVVKLYNYTSPEFTEYGDANKLFDNTYFGKK